MELLTNYGYLISDIKGLIISKMKDPLKLLKISEEMDNLVCLNTLELDLKNDSKYYNIITNNKLQKFINLTSLDLYDNKKITDNGIKNLKNLTFLNLQYNKLITNNGISN